jgi:dihydrofolate synthase/folylpolyglutamate synthase
VKYTDAVNWLYHSELHGIKLGLGNITRLVEELGIKLTGPGAPLFIHVAGTNGKGSVCAFLDAICRAAGKRTGLFTSPHLLTFRERIRINGEMIGEAETARCLTMIRQLSVDWKHPPTFFEITTALALRSFVENKAEIVILETGMGGRLDATNVVTPVVSVITPIYLDHQQWLGNTLKEIAFEKAGIIKPDVPVVSAWQREEVLQVLRHVAKQQNSTIHVVVTPIGLVKIGLVGAHQRWNAALALHALDAAGLHFSDDAIIKGLKDVLWPGRFQIVGDRIVLDGAHNHGAARQLAETWREVYGDARPTLILGSLKDKDTKGMCEALAPIAARVLTVPVRSQRSATAEELRETLWEVAPQVECAVAVDCRTAIAIARAFKDEKILIAGSLYLIGEALSCLRGSDAPEEGEQ